MPPPKADAPLAQSGSNNFNCSRATNTHSVKRAFAPGAAQCKAATLASHAATFLLNNMPQHALTPVEPQPLTTP
jgi:hypothetical protein